MQPPAGFRELIHTADWELQAWAPDLPALLEQAARGMYSLSGIRLEPGKTQERCIYLQAADAESLLVRFLSELLWYIQLDRLGVESFSLNMDAPLTLKANLDCLPIVKLDKEIKAVTYHNLEVRSTESGLQVNIVFDV